MADQNDTETPRDRLRAAIFSDHQFKRKSVSIFGTDVELRQPSLAEIQTVAGANFTVVDILLKYGYVPGTNTKAFDEADREALGNLPATTWIKVVADNFAELATIDSEEAAKN